MEVVLQQHTQTEKNQASLLLIVNIFANLFRQKKKFFTEALLFLKSNFSELKIKDKVLREFSHKY